MTSVRGDEDEMDALLKMLVAVIILGGLLYSFATGLR